MSNSLGPWGLYSPWNSPWNPYFWSMKSHYSRGSFQPRDRTQVSHIADRFFTSCHKGSPRILEWVDYSFSRGSSSPRNRTRISWTAGGFFTNWAVIIHKSPLCLCMCVCVCVCVCVYLIFPLVIEHCLSHENGLYLS